MSTAFAFPQSLSVACSDHAGCQSVLNRKNIFLGVLPNLIDRKPDCRVYGIQEVRP